MLISIHPPLAGRDSCWCSARTRRWHFNPPAPCGAGLCHEHREKAEYRFQSTRPLRGGTFLSQNGITFYVFQSTRPLRGGTGPRCDERGRGTDFNPPAPCGAGPNKRAANRHNQNFNPPAPCGAGPDRHGYFFFIHVFQSTRPLRGGTSTHYKGGDTMAISIHPPLAGRDT